MRIEWNSLLSFVEIYSGIYRKKKNGPWYDKLWNTLAACFGNISLGKKKNGV